jgi:Na+/melibiose symporter-like transporter
MRQEMNDLATVTNRHKVLLTHLLLIVAASVVVDAIGTALMYYLERNAQGSEIHSVFDAFFFTTVQLLTVSSQLKNPVTNAGRIVDIFLEIWAVLVVAGSAGAFANFVQSDN